ncbi:bone marrow proteoglycan-like [Puma concolor]|uniref:Bone marrow proteoglycan-like n=1 Tax=Puma concolor TaxID=9696 RepID=A0A6P6I814_PUMCO|nr:bone marrow proteoglycan-like [Puma concolor]
MEAPMGQLTLLEEEEGCSGGEDAPEEEGAVEFASALDEVDKGFQCPKEEDTVKLEGISGCKTCPRFRPVRKAQQFQCAQSICRRCYQGNLISIHSYNLDYRIFCSARGLNENEVWIGAINRGWFKSQSFQWTDGSCWHFGYWASGQPFQGQGNCVTLCTTDTGPYFVFSQPPACEFTVPNF